MYGALGNIVLPSCEDKFKVKTVCVCVRERGVFLGGGESDCGAPLGPFQLSIWYHSVSFAQVEN